LSCFQVLIFAECNSDHRSHGASRKPGCHSLFTFQPARARCSNNDSPIRKSCT
jgi:hypothetical protein